MGATVSPEGWVSVLGRRASGDGSTDGSGVWVVKMVSTTASAGVDEMGSALAFGGGGWAGICGCS